MVEGEPIIDEAIQVFDDILAVMTEKRINLTVKEVSEKYGLTNKILTEADFYRICEAENLMMLNDDPFVKSKRTKFNNGYVYKSKDVEGTYIVLSDALEGEALLIQMFYLLGSYFLHYAPGTDPFKDIEAYEKRSKEAECFTKQLLKIDSSVITAVKKHSYQIAA